MKMARKGQAATDMLLSFAFLLIVFLIVLVIVKQRTDFSVKEQVRLEAKEVADRLAQEINSVYLAGEGMEKNYYLPGSLRGKDSYNLSIYAEHGFVEVMWIALGETRVYDAPLITRDVTGDLVNLFGRVSIINQNNNINVTSGGW